MAAVSTPPTGLSGPYLESGQVGAPSCKAIRPSKKASLHQADIEDAAYRMSAPDVAGGELLGRRGSEQVAAGFSVFGPRTLVVLALPQKGLIFLWRGPFA